MTARPPDGRVVAMDLDGVIVDSEPIKLAAFLDAVEPDLDASDLHRVDEYNRAHRGIPRKRKFDEIAAHNRRVCPRSLRGSRGPMGCALRGVAGGPRR